MKKNPQIVICKPSLLRRFRIIFFFFKRKVFRIFTITRVPSKTRTAVQCSFCALTFCQYEEYFRYPSFTLLSSGTKYYSCSFSLSLSPSAPYFQGDFLVVINHGVINDTHSNFSRNDSRHQFNLASIRFIYISDKKKKKFSYIISLRRSMRNETKRSCSTMTRSIVSGWEITKNDENVTCFESVSPLHG